MLEISKLYRKKHSFQTLNYVPEVVHNDRRLYCDYEQRDEGGDVIMTSSDHVTVRVFYLEEPTAERQMPPAIVSDSLFRFLDSN